MSSNANAKQQLQNNYKSSSTLMSYIKCDIRKEKKELDSSSACQELHEGTHA
jgi:hypothetical protein